MSQNRPVRCAAFRGLCVVLALPAFLLAGCPTSSEGIDLTERGDLTLTISRVSQSTVATATALVLDNKILSFPYTKIVLSDDQILSINDVPLDATTRTALGLDATVAATIEAADTPDVYEIRFDNQGVITLFETTPPEDFEAVTPEAYDEISVEGFELTWEPSDDDDVTIEIAITGQSLSYSDSGELETIEHTVSLTDLVDDGAVTIGSAELYYFLFGEIGVTLTRAKTISQKLGFASGTLRLEINHEMPLMLVDPNAG